MSDPAPSSTEKADTRGPIHRFRIGANVFVQVGLFLVLFGLVNYLSFRHHLRWDLTQNQDYTLTSTTRNLLAGLDENVRIIVAFARGSEIFDDVRILAEEYGRQSDGHIKVEIVDPARNPNRAEELKNQYRFSLEQNTVIVALEPPPAEEAGAPPPGGAESTPEEAETPLPRMLFLDEDNLGRFSSRNFQDRRLLEFRGEDALTSALISVTERGPRKLYLVSGKGTLPATPGGTDASHVLLDLCTQQNIALVGLNLSDVSAIPEDADGVVVIRPQVDFSERELTMLRDYWEGERGAFLALLDPLHDTPRLNALLEDFGVRLQDDRVLYAENTPTGGPQRVFEVRSNFVPGSPITGDLLGITTRFNGQTRSMALGEDADSLRQRNVEVRPLLEATERYWGETAFLQQLPTYDERLDNAPPIYVAASVERGAVSDAAVNIESSRMVIISNPALLDPADLVGPSYDFVSSCLNWLLDRDELIGIPPKVKSQFSLDITSDERARIFWLVGIFLPAGVICFGLFVWSTRRA